MLDTEVRYVKGVGERLSKLMGKLGVFTVRDLLTHFPHRYEDRSRFLKIGQLRPGDAATFIGTVAHTENVRTPRSHKLLTKVAVQDGTGVVTLVWFNQHYIKPKFDKLRGREIVVYGTALYSNRGLEIVNPEWEEEDSGGDSTATGRIVPVYPLTEGLFQSTVRKAIHRALDTYLSKLGDVLPDEIMNRRDLVDVQCAYKNIHFPESQEALDAAR